MGSGGFDMTAKGYGNIKVTDANKRMHLYEQALKCIDREENLIHYRMTWGLQWNVGAFAALVVLLSSELQDRYKEIIASGLAFFGIIVCGIAFIAVMAAHRQSWFVINNLCKRLDIEGHDWSRSEFIRPYGEPNTVHRAARWFSKFLFWIIVIFWIGIIYFIIIRGISFSFPSSN
jgi:hypothetical protein